MSAAKGDYMATDRQRFLTARQALHWSRQVAADYLGCTKNAIYRYETQHDEFARGVPPDALDWLETIAREFRALLQRKPAPPPAD
jgi:transcriptional regulator with XRE-family HTH domain